MNLLSDDTKYRGKGKIIDIQVVCNIDDPDEVLSSTYNKQIYHYYKQQQNYFNNFIKYIQPIITNKEYKVSQDLIDLYNYYCRLTDPMNKFILGDNLFDHLKMKFTILEECPLVIGSKLAGRYGDKGVLSKILPDDEMPKITDFAGIGKPDDDSLIDFKIDMILNPLGVPNRLNPSQNIEVEINYNSKFIRYQLEQHWEEWSLEQAKKYFLDYIKVVGEEDYKHYKKIFDSLNEDEQEELLAEIIEKGIPIHQPPINGVKNIKDLARIYKYTGVDKSKFKDMYNPIIFGEKFMMTLKHIPAAKFSARSVDQLSIKNIPVKSDLYKQYKADYSTNSIKIGEMENIGGLGLANPANKFNMRINKKFLDAQANNEETRQNLLKAQLSENPYDFDIEFSDKISENSKIFKTFINSMQLELENDEENFDV
jgi:DNA-directed RNA polymerase beta subunit